MELPGAFLLNSLLSLELLLFLQTLFLSIFIQLLLLVSQLLNLLHELVPLILLNDLMTDSIVSSNAIGQEGPSFSVFP